MSNARKLLSAMESNPLDWKMAQVQTVAKAFGLTIHKPGGSHHVLRHANGGKISIPARRPIKPIYIRQLVRLIRTGLGDE